MSWAWSVPTDAAVLTLRWESTGPAGLFPPLDADLTLTPAGSDRCRLSLAGEYNPPLGPLGSGLDRAILHRAAQATARSFVHRVAEDMDARCGAVEDPGSPSPGA